MLDAGPSSRVTVHKFGGSSLADPGCYRRVAGLLLSNSQIQDLVVVSAAGKTTNKLLKLQQLHEQGRDVSILLADLASYQQQLILELITEPAPLLDALAEDLEQLGLWLADAHLSLRQQNNIVALGECWSSRLLAALLAQSGRPAQALDSRSFLKAEGTLTPLVDEPRSRELLEQQRESHGEVQLVITGFICADQSGDTLLLGRNGSDYSATLVANLAGAGEVNIWTDVAGVFSADPNLIHEARLIEELSLAEAQELGRLGNPVLHHRTLQPLAENKIALRVRSSFDSELAYTEIGKRLGHVGDCIINGVSSVSLFLLAGETALLEEAEQALLSQGLQPLTRNRQGERLVLSFTREVAPSVQTQLQLCNGVSWSVDQEHGLISLLDAGISFYRVLFNKLLEKETDFGVVQSDNGLSLSCLIKRDRVNLLSHLLHHKIYCPVKRIGVVLFGAGNIGSTWLTLFKQQQDQLQDQFNVTLSLAGIVRSNGALINFNGIDSDHWQQTFEREQQAWSYPSLLKQLKGHPFDELIVLDISASESLSDHYLALLSQGHHLISANKLAGSSSRENYQRLQDCISANGVLWRTNATVGAGLPVQYALGDLRDSGDQLKSISGVFSGTLSWLFEHYNADEPFSELMLRARELGITEPDPRDDLSGKDMQRKLLILMREAGLDLELDDIRLESMVPEKLAKLPLAEFLSQANLLDGPMADLYHRAAEQNSVMRYVAAYDSENGASVSLQKLPESHPFANLTPSDNVFMLTSEWYQDNPLVIRGPGAGREVTAAAVQSDLFQIVRHLSQ